ncbi:hypothetical protein SCHPADRAFT_941438 [Schizopora paradoxa]|uniref:cAMP-independent regulatory protein pac2 n=1 Tax=Schizopora paradoxa TaxID=27342 RepID=A0A0H2RJH9_9AGAM|nr:hypothetical protein SCHPADRAFT_941438 [Schizopora paradoxa]
MPPNPHAGHTTHPALHLRDAADAHVVFEAVRLNLLPLVKRRLTTEEREQLSSGNVFVWEEAEHKGGLERWTDGRRWSQSRMKGEFLFYEEKIETTEEEKQAKAARRANRSSGSHQTYTPMRRQDRPAKIGGLTKCTYSTHVAVQGSTSARKWHIVAYFSGNDYNRLPVIENYDYLRNIRIPEGIFFSSKGSGKRGDRSNPYGDDDDDYQSSYDGGSYGPPSPVQHLAGPSDLEHRRRSNSQHGGYPSDMRFQSPGHGILRPGSTRPLVPRTISHDSAALPRLASIAPLPSTNHHHSIQYSPSPIEPNSGSSRFPPSHLPSSSNYLPLSPEDRRALNTFKVVL